MLVQQCTSIDRHTALHCMSPWAIVWALYLSLNCINDVMMICCTVPTFIRILDVRLNCVCVCSRRTIRRRVRGALETTQPGGGRQNAQGALPRYLATSTVFLRILVLKFVLEFESSRIYSNECWFLKDNIYMRRVLITHRSSLSFAVSVLSWRFMRSSVEIAERIVRRYRALESSTVWLCLRCAVRRLIFQMGSSSLQSSVVTFWLLHYPETLTLNCFILIIMSQRGMLFLLRMASMYLLLQFWVWISYSPSICVRWNEISKIFKN